MGIVLVLLLLLQVPSLQAIYRFLPYPFAISSLVLLGSFSVYYLLLVRKPKLGWLSTSLLSFGLLALPFLISFAAYLSLHAVGFGPTDADIDDAMIVPIQSLIQGFGLYGKPLYTHHPISPGPGWLLLNAPFSFFAYPVFSLFVPFYLLIMVFTFVKQGKNGRFINVLLILLFSSIYFWKLLIAGYDLIPLACLFLVVFLTIEEYELKKTAFFFLVVLTGIVATSRLVFLMFPLLLSLFHWKKNKPQSLTLAVGGTTIALALHYLFYNSPYPPLHLLEKATLILSPITLLIALVLAVGVGVAILRTSLKNKTRRLWLYTIALALPLAAISLSDAWNVGFSWANWEAAAYPICIAPLAIYSALQSTKDFN